MVKPAGFRVLSTLAIAFIALASPLRAQFAYVANYTDNTLSGYSIASNGALTPVAGSPYPAGFQPKGMGVVQNKFVYVVTGDPVETIIGYSIASDGALSTIPGSPFPAAMGCSTLNVDPLGRFLFLPAGDAIYVYTIGSNGALTAVAGSPFQGKGAYGLAIDPSGTFAFGLTGGHGEAQAIWEYQIESTGALTLVTHYATAKHPSSLTVDPTGKFLYGTAYRCFTGYRITSKGALKGLTGFPMFHAGKGGFAIDPSGKFAYVPDPTPGINSILAYRIGSTGELRPVPKMPFGKAGWGETAIDPTGKFFYQVNGYVEKNDAPLGVSGYVIGANGALTAIPGSPFAAGNLPYGIAITSQ